MEIEKAIDQEAENKAKDYAEILCSCYTNDYYGFYNGFISGYNFAQQNTLTLDSKVDDEGNLISEPVGWKKYRQNKKIPDSWILPCVRYKQTPTIKQRLDNEKALREGIKELINSMVGTHSVMTTPIMNYLQNLLNQ